MCEHRATGEWRAALASLGTDSSKLFLETDPWRIAVFYEAYIADASSAREKHYYPMDSTGIATGALVTALHHAGSRRLSIRRA